MLVKMKDGFAPLRIKMLGKVWKIPKHPICQEVYEVVKDKVEILDEQDLAAAKADKAMRVERSAKRRAKILKEKWEAKHPKQVAAKKAVSAKKAVRKTVKTPKAK